MDEELIDIFGLHSLKHTLQDIGGWPILDQDKWKSQRSYKWYKQVLKMDKAGFYKESQGIVTYAIQRHPKDISKSILVLQGPSSINSYLAEGFENEKVQKYFEIMVNTSVMLGASEERARRELKESLLFEIELAKLSNKSFYHENTIYLDALKSVWGPFERRFDDEMERYNNSTYVELDKIYEALTSINREYLPSHPPSWTAFFNQWLKHYGEEVKGYEQVMLPDKDYLQGVLEILAKYDNDPRIIANYLGWLVVQRGLDFLGKKEKMVSIQLAKTFCSCKGDFICLQCYRATNIEQTERWETCSEEAGFGGMNEDWRGAAGSLYVRAYMDSSHKKILVEMIKNIRMALSQMIRESGWMDHETMQNALKKLDRMKQIAAYQDEIINKTLVDGFFEGEKNFLAYDEYLSSSLVQEFAGR